MEYRVIEEKESAVKIQLGKFSIANGVSEYHVMIENTDKPANATSQYKRVNEALKQLAASSELKAFSLVWKRYFVSDAINHASLLPEHDDCAVSVVQQPALNGTKVVVWAYFVEDCTVSRDESGSVLLKRSSYIHIYDTQYHSHEENEYEQTEVLFDNYSKQLALHNCTLKDNTIRTWIYVQGVDTHYAGMVEARKVWFEKEGLTEQTHYIASTGIEGKYVHPETIVLMDAYSIKGISTKQVVYLKGASHLNPTSEYGVTFERATAVDFGDRRHIYVSGTASIDNKGNIVHLLEIDKQIERTLENIEVLLKEGKAEMNDIAQMIVYIRDTADYQLVDNYMKKEYPDIPKVIVWAPVCRPGWLIEIECIAITELHNENFDRF